jgi:hypothetical protein
MQVTYHFCKHQWEHIGNPKTDTRLFNFFQFFLEIANNGNIVATNKKEKEKEKNRSFLFAKMAITSASILNTLHFFTEVITGRKRK